MVVLVDFPQLSSWTGWHLAFYLQVMIWWYCTAKLCSLVMLQFLICSPSRCGSFSSSSVRTPSAGMIVQAAFFSACFFCTTGRHEGKVLVLISFFNLSKCPPLAFFLLVPSWIVSTCFEVSFSLPLLSPRQMW